METTATLPAGRDLLLIPTPTKSANATGEKRAKKKVGAKISLYPCRHTFATRALMRGVDCITVATLMGHSDTSTLAKVYQHVSQNPEFLKGQLLKAAG